MKVASAHRKATDRPGAEMMILAVLRVQGHELAILDVERVAALSLPVRMPLWLCQKCNRG